MVEKSKEFEFEYKAILKEPVVTVRFRGDKNFGKKEFEGKKLYDVNKQE